MDMEEHLEALAASRCEAADADRARETVSDQLAEAWEAEADYWLQEETEAAAYERMSPAEQEADQQFGARIPFYCAHCRMREVEAPGLWCDPCAGEER
jgi:hypothetical protein